MKFVWMYARYKGRIFFDDLEMYMTRWRRLGVRYLRVYTLLNEGACEKHFEILLSVLSEKSELEFSI